MFHPISTKRSMEACCVAEITFNACVSACEKGQQREFGARGTVFGA